MARRRARRRSLPSRVAAVYRQIADAYRTTGRSIFALALVVFIPLGLLDAAAAQAEGAIDFSDGFKLATALLAAGAVTTTGLLGEVFFAGAISVALTHPGGDAPPLRRVAREVSYGRLIAIDVIYVVLVAVGVLFLVVPGVLVFVLLGLAGPLVELEDRGIRGALAHSARLVRTDFWLVFWVLVPVEVVGDAIGSGLEHLVDGVLGGGFLGAWLAEAASNVVLSPLFAVAAVLLTLRLGGGANGGAEGPRAKVTPAPGRIDMGTDR